jgi:outer membrane protein OmpA-like peptidoglycan-associated protein
MTTPNFLSGALLSLALLAATPVFAADRVASLREQNNISGTSGLLHLAAPGSGEPGTFRLSLLADSYSGSGFLCSTDAPCATSSHDQASHFGTALGASVSVLPFLEAYGSLRSFVNSDDAHSPGLLAVLNNSALGAKLFLPRPIAGLFSLGGAAELNLLSGSGSVGFNGGSTGLRLTALGALDLRGLEKPIPVRILTNVGYKLDNSSVLIEDTEQHRGRPISRLERSGLDINRVDALQLGLGAEGSLSFARPFVEYNLSLPVNRQAYKCLRNKLESGDVCLAEHQSLSYFPSVLTLGVRATPWLEGLTGTLAFDIGTSGTSHFLEELAPTLPWDFWFGLGYAFDTVKPPPEKVVVREPAPTAPPPTPKPLLRARGFVHEKDKNDAIADVIVRYRGRDSTAMASGADGHFVSDALPPGSYTFDLSVSGYKNGECSVTLVEAPAKGSADQLSEVDCPLEALPRAGTVSGRVIDADSSTPIANVTVELTDSLQRSLNLTTDASGSFRFENVLPGKVALKAESGDYLFHTQALDLHAREDAHPELGLHKRPKVSLVQVSANEIKIKQQVHFENDSAVIALDSNALLEQIADVLARTPTITQLEIQGHTDNAGTPQHNSALSEARAGAVVEWLTAHGIDGARLVARGYGQDRPIAPNVTPSGRARNRRVQFMILH